MFLKGKNAFSVCYRNVGGNIRDGISGLSGSVMSKPREFAHLIKNKFGSADNINQLSSSKFDCKITFMLCAILGFCTIIDWICIEMI